MCNVVRIGCCREGGQVGEWVRKHSVFHAIKGHGVNSINVGLSLGVCAEICTSGVQNDEQIMRCEISPRQGK